MLYLLLMSKDHERGRHRERTPLPQPDLLAFLHMGQNRDEVTRRATVILDITDNDDPYLKMFRIEAEAFAQSDGDHHDLRHKEIARIRAEKGVEALEKLLANDTLAATRPRQEIFQGLRHATSLKNHGHEPPLSFVRSVIENFPPQIVTPEGLEVFAATVGFAQEYIIQQLGAKGDTHKKYRHAIRSNVFSYARSILEMTDNREFLKHVARPHKSKPISKKK